MKIFFVCIGLALLPALSSCGQRLNVQPPPEPPHQRTPWRPEPNSIPTNFLSAAKALFEQGFPDPRGCEYREIEVEVSGVWGAAIVGNAPSNHTQHIVHTRGWVFPEKSGQTERFAICWNGLIYPVGKVGAVGNLHSEAVNLPLQNSRPFGRPNSAVGESRSVFSTNALSTRVLLLLRVGETEAALTNWVPNHQAFFGGRGRGMSNGDSMKSDPYFEFAGDWAWALFDRTLCAHMRGDEALALVTARKLAEVQPKIEAEAAKRGFPRPQSYSPPGQQKEKPYLTFLDQFPQLLADLERRAREGARVSVVQSGLQNIPNQSGRIAALIRDLDLIQARQWSQPGGVNPADDTIVSALIHEGDAAVEPLLDCLETDKRLTRSVSFGRDFFRDRNVLPVASVARNALQTILHAGFQGGAAEIRAYWNKYKGLKLEDRWYAILKDDSVGMGRWLEAAGNITQGENVATFPGGFSRTKQMPANAPIRMLGESLREKSNPSVAELMARRAVEIIPSNPSGYDLSAACEIGLRLAAWDPKAAAPAAKALVERFLALMTYSDQRRNSWPEQRLGTLIAKLTLARAQGGDPRAFEDYATWLRTTTPEQLQTYIGDSLEPLRKFPTNEVLQTAADSLFNETNSAWGKLPWKNTGGFNPVESELLNVPAFRRLLSRELQRKTVCGSIQWHDPNMASFQITNQMNMGGSRGLLLPENERPANGTKTELRWCDWIAWLLSNSKQIPAFNPFAPIEMRDELIQAAKATLLLK